MSFRERLKKISEGRWQVMHIFTANVLPREVKKKFVVEIAFDSVDLSKRHKSGVALRFPRIKRLRQDKPINEVININLFKENFINN